MKRVLQASLAAGLGVAVIMGSFTAKAAEEIKLTVISGLPPVVKGTGMIDSVFIERVNEELAKTGNYKIDWTRSYGGSVAKQPEVFETVQAGIADMGYVNILFEGAKMPMEQFTMVTPFCGTNLMDLRNVNLELRDKIPQMGAQYEKHNQIDLAHTGVPNFILVTKFPVNSLADLDGKKIGAPGLAKNWLTNTGAVAVAGSLSTYYNSLKTGVYDGIVMFDSGIAPLKFYEVAQYITKVDFGSMMTSALTINKDRWESLPEEVKNVMKKVAPEYEKQVVQALMKQADWSLQTSVKNGAKLNEFPAEERKKMANAIPNIAKQWAASVDDRGLPGTRLLETYMELSRKTGINCARPWDK